MAATPTAAQPREGSIFQSGQESPAARESPALTPRATPTRARRAVGKQPGDGIPDNISESSLQQVFPERPRAPGQYSTGSDEDASVDMLQEEEKLRSDPWRFSVGFFFYLLSFTNAFQWINFSPIVDEVRTYFDISAVEVNFLGTTFVISYAAVVFLSCKLYEVTGLKLGIVVAASCNLIAPPLKLLAVYAWPNVGLLYVAQIIASFAEVLVIATPPLLVNLWFPVKERIVANTVLTTAVNFGCGIGVLFPTLFVGPNKQKKGNFAALFWFETAVCLVPMLGVIFLFPRRPRYAASYAAALLEEKEARKIQTGGHHHGHAEGDGGDDVISNRSAGRQSRRSPGAGGSAGRVTPSHHRTISQQSGHSRPIAADLPETEAARLNIFSTVMDVLREAGSSYSFVFLTLASACILGIIWSVAAVLPQLLGTYGVSEAESGWIGFLNLLGGSVLGPFVVPLVDRYGKNYKRALMACSCCFSIAISIMTLAFAYGPPPSENRNFYVVIAFIMWGGVAGFSQNLFWPLVFEYVVELTFPMAESTSAPTLTWSSCFTSFILTLIYGQMLGDNPSQADTLRVLILCVVVAVFGSVCVLMTFPFHRRHDYEEMKRLEREEREAGGSDGGEGSSSDAAIEGERDDVK